MRRLRLLFGLLLLAPPAPGQDFVYSSGQTEANGYLQYHWRVLAEALERTRPAFGDYRMISAGPLPVSRQIYELSHDQPRVNIAVLTVRSSFEGKLIAVKIPIDRGLLGYRVLLIRQGDQARFSAVRGVADLRDVRFGFLPWWVDAAVTKAAGLPVVDGDTYDGLFRMLAAHRFDALSRGASEVLQDVDRMKPVFPDLAIETHLVLRYPLPAFFWFRDDEEGRRRAVRVKAGLEQMVADGTLRKMFYAEFGATLAKLDLAHRLVIDLDNPMLDAKTLPANPELWYDPLQNIK